MHYTLIKTIAISCLVYFYLPWPAHGQSCEDEVCNDVQIEQYNNFSDYFDHDAFQLRIINAQTGIPFFQLTQKDLIMQSYGLYSAETVKQKNDIYTLIDQHNFSRSISSHEKSLNNDKPADLRLRCKQYFILLASRRNIDLDEGELRLQMLDDQLYIDPSLNNTSGDRAVNLIYGQYCYYL